MDTSLHPKPASADEPRRGARRTLYIGIAVAVILVIGSAVAWALSRSASPTTPRGIEPVSSVSPTEPSSPESETAGVDGTATPDGKAATTPSESVTASGSGGSDDPAGGGTDGQNAGGEQPDAGTSQPAAPKPVAVPRIDARVILWNDTVSKPVPNLRIEIRDVEGWSPKRGVKKLVHTFDNVPMGRTLFLDVYLDGKPGSRLGSEILYSDGMVPDSDVDAVHVQVTDTFVRVLGNPVDNFERKYKR